MKRTFLKALLAMAAVFVVLVAVPFCENSGMENFLSVQASALEKSGKCGVNLTYSYNSSTKALVISGTGDMYDYSDTESPFRESDIKSVVIKQGVTNISYGAFDHCRSLTKVTIPDSVTGIAAYAFRGCYALTSVTFGNGVKNIGYYAFYNCENLESIIIPDSIETIGEEAFGYCYKLKNISLPDKAIYFGYNVFTDTAFYNDKSNWTDGVLYLGAHLVKGDTKLTTLEIKPGTKNILNSAFNGCKKLEDVIFPDSLEIISDSAFYGCESLLSVDFPEGLKSIGEDAFYKCKSITDIVIPEGVEKVGASAFSNCGDIEELTIFGSETVFDWNSFSNCNVETLYLKTGEELFHDGHINLKHLVILDGVTEISSYAFNNFKELESVILPEGITCIGSSAFSGCSSLKEINLPESLMKIMSGAFAECTELTSVIIPENVNYVGNDAFYGCDSLEEVTLLGNIEEFKWEVFSETTIETLNLASVAVPEEMRYLDIKTVNFLDGVTEIAEDACRGLEYVTTVTMPDTVKSIGDSAFEGCEALSNLTLSVNIESIGKNAFNGCTELEAVVLGDGLKTIGDYAFANCSYLTDINIPESVTYIGENIFQKTAWHNYRGKGIIIFDNWVFGYKGSVSKDTVLNLDKNIRGVADEAFKDESNFVAINVDAENPLLLSENGILYNKNKTEIIVYPCGKADKEYIMPDTVLSVGDETFYNCINLNKVEISSAAKTLGEYSFYGCEYLHDLYIPEGVEEIPEYAFAYCERLHNLTIPDSVVSIGNSAFSYIGTSSYWDEDYGEYKRSLNIKIGDRVKFIGEYSFYDAGSGYNDKIILGNSVEKIGRYAFEYTDITDIQFPDSLKVIENGAFYHSDLKNLVIPDSVEYIGSGAFSYNSSLKEVTFGTGIKEIGSDIFSSCDDLESIYCAVSQRHWNAIKGYDNIPADVDLYLSHPHEYTYTVEVEPTCTETGVGRYTCKFGDSYTVDIPATGHSWILDEESCVAPTCTVPGKDVYECEKCGETREEKIDLGGHKWTETSYTAPTCNEEGERYLECTVCKETDIEVVSSTGHFPMSVAQVNATCTEDGLTLGSKCYVCGEILEGCEVIPATGHTETEVGRTEPDCVNPGYEEGVVCSVCGEVISGRVITPALGHSFVDYISDNNATCTVDGTKTAECTACEATDTITDEGSAKGHTEVVVPAVAVTCSTDGYNEGKSCSVCGEFTVEPVLIPALGHDFECINEVAPTCTVDGSKTYRCKRANCGYEYTESIRPIEHNYSGDWVTTKEPTCDEFGLQVNTCLNCKGTIEKAIDPTGHKSVELPEVPSTCTENGYTEGTQCEVCHKILSGHRLVAKLGHDYGEYVVTKKATCDENGIEESACSRCDSKKQNTLLKTGHNYPDKWSVISPATCTATGMQMKICFTCNGILTEKIPANGHKYKTTVTKATLSANGKSVTKCTVCDKTSSSSTIYKIKSISLSDTNYTYNGKIKAPTVIVKDTKGKALVNKTDYTVKYSSGRKSVGKYSVTVTFKGNYSGSKTLYFYITPVATSYIKTDTSSTSLKPSWKAVSGAAGYKVELINSKGKVVKTVETKKLTYTFSGLSRNTAYKIRVRAYISVSGSKIYAIASKTVSTRTLPSAPALKAAAGKKSAKLSWNKVSCSGYVITYSTDSKFKSSKTLTISKASSRSATVSNLTTGKTYYFRIRAFTTVGSEKYYSSYSNIIAVKIK